MKMSIPKEKLVLQGVLGLLLIAAAYGAWLQMKVGDLESNVQMANKTGEDTNTQLKGALAKLAAANTKLMELEKKQKETDSLKTLLASIDQHLYPALEGAAKTAKPNVRANILAGVGLIGQLSHGLNNESAIAALDRAVTSDKTNCPAGIALNMSGAKQLELPAECQAFLPVAEVKPAAPAPAAAPAAAAKADAPKAEAAKEAPKADAKK